MDAVERVSAEKARTAVESDRALLVCAYDSDEKFRQYHIPEAISLEEFRAREATIPKEREIIFYCA